MATYAELWIRLHATPDGGRSNPLDLSDERPGFYRPRLRPLSAPNESFVVEVVQGPAEPVPPGGEARATVRLLSERVGLDEGVELEVLEGEKVVGRARVVRASTS